MTQMNKHYESEFKKKIVRLHLEEGRTLKGLAAEYGVSKASISIWVKQFREECLTNTQIRRVHAYIKWRIWLYYEQFRPFKALKLFHPLGEIKKQLKSL